MSAADTAWAGVDAALVDAKAIVFDGCHKIYLAMDDQEVATFTELGYGVDDDGSKLIMVTDQATARQTLEQWFDESCSLRFINSVRTVDTNPNDGFEQLIAQFELDDDDDDDDVDLCDSEEDYAVGDED